MTETRVEYAVRYEDGKCSAPASRDGAEGWARYCRETGLDHGASVVRRTVTYGEWEPVE